MLPHPVIATDSSSAVVKAIAFTILFFIILLHKLANSFYYVIMLAVYFTKVNSKSAIFQGHCTILT